MRKRAAVLALGLIVVAGCADDDDDISDAARDELQPRIAEIRQLADARRTDQAKVELDQLRGLVEDLRARGELSDREASAILTAAGEVNAQLGLITTTTQPPPPPRDHGDEDEEDEKDEKGGKDEDD